MVRLIHTADWHLGHTLHGISREQEHRRFLEWLLETLVEHQADALVISGDVFDSCNPSAEAQRMLYRFLAEAHRRLSDLDVVMVAGNHDSPARLEAPAPLLAELGAVAIGLVPRTPGGEIDIERLLVPLHDREGRVGAWCVALPYLRPADLPPVDPVDPVDPADPERGDPTGERPSDPLVEGVRRLYDQALDAARQRLEPGQSLVVTGHCYMVGTALSEISERKILGGNLHALPAALFPADVSYAALGHLHLAQSVGGRAELRYAGSPLPLSLVEASYPHQVVQVDLDNGACSCIEPVRVPRTVRILRLPPGGPAPMDEVLEQLAGLGESLGAPEEGLDEPLLEVRVHLEEPEPDLRRRVLEALGDAPVRLARISVTRAGSGTGLAKAGAGRQLDDLSPEEVFERRYAEQYDGAPPEDLVAAFAELLEQVRQEAS